MAVSNTSFDSFLYLVWTACKIKLSIPLLPTSSLPSPSLSHLYPHPLLPSLTLYPRVPHCPPLPIIPSLIHFTPSLQLYPLSPLPYPHYTFPLLPSNFFPHSPFTVLFPSLPSPLPLALTFYPL